MSTASTTNPTTKTATTTPTMINAGESELVESESMRLGDTVALASSEMKKQGAQVVKEDKRRYVPMSCAEDAALKEIDAPMFACEMH